MLTSELYKYFKESSSVSTDTRLIKKGSIFFALKGENFDGNKFAEEAINNGASYAIIDDHSLNNPKFIKVKNALKSLQDLSNFHRSKFLKTKIIALTGSNGKTTTKELILAVLKTQFNATATRGNLNNHIGVPLTILSFTNETEIGIVEMGANHQKEIEFLTTICEPDLGYITNFGKAHLEGFGGEEGVIKGKSELYTYLKEHNKTVLINSEDPIQLKLTSSLNSIVLNNGISIQSIQPFLTLYYNKQEIKTHLVGGYNETNIKAAISIGEYYGITEKNIITAIEGYHPTNNRSQLIKKKSNTLLLDAYNANPTSTLVALDNFSSLKHSSKVAILGDMFELGNYAFDEHENIVTYCKTLDIHRCIFVGEEFCKTNALEKYEDLEKLKTEITKSPLKNSCILIKGSRGMSLERLLEIIN